jgi:hypothetical protein
LAVHPASRREFVERAAIVTPGRLPTEQSSNFRSVPTRLTDEFLIEIATRYVMHGRGYAKAIAAQRNVSTRTVISWVEKARARGILTATTPGSVGGSVNPPPTA